LHLRYYRRICTDRCLLHRLSCEAAADDTFDDDGLMESDLLAGVMNRNPAADSGAGRGSVHFTVGEYANVPAVNSLTDRRRDEDRAIQEPQVRLERMGDGSRPHDGPLDGHPGPDEGGNLFRHASQAHLICPDVGVESTAKSKIICDRSQILHLDCFIESEDEGRDIPECHARRAAVTNPDASCYESCGTVDSENCFRFRKRHHSGFDRDGRDCDDAVGVTGGVTMQPYISLCPRGSHMIAVLRLSYFSFRTLRRARIVSPARSGNPLRTIRNGSPPVWASSVVIVRQVLGGDQPRSFSRGRKGIMTYARLRLVGYESIRMEEPQVNGRGSLRDDIGYQFAGDRCEGDADHGMAGCRDQVLARPEPSDVRQAVRRAGTQPAPRMCRVDV
jgi:hypothetical protein